MSQQKIVGMAPSTSSVTFIDSLGEAVLPYPGAILTCLGMTHSLTRSGKIVGTPHKVLCNGSSTGFMDFSALWTALPTLEENVCASHLVPFGDTVKRWEECGLALKIPSQHGPRLLCEQGPCFPSPETSVKPEQLVK
jgi:hypothetical protein